MHPLQCSVGDRVAVLVNPALNKRMWWIGEVVDEDLVAQTAIFSFPGQLVRTAIFGAYALVFMIAVVSPVYTPRSYH